MKNKVRKDFDPAKEYSVDVSKCTVEEKKAVQQAFFDAGIPWVHGYKSSKNINVMAYTNKLINGRITPYVMSDDSAEECNMTAKEFLDLVYESEKKGHVHAELMAQYAEDAKTSKTPWELWEYLDKHDGWTTFKGSPGWYETSEYRRKPKTHIVNGVEIPDLRVSPEFGEYYYLADPTESGFTSSYVFHGEGLDSLWSDRGLAYQHTEEGKQAAILHAKAMIDMVQE